LILAWFTAKIGNTRGAGAWLGTTGNWGSFAAFCLGDLGVLKGLGGLGGFKGLGGVAGLMMVIGLVPGGKPAVVGNLGRALWLGLGRRVASR